MPRVVLIRCKAHDRNFAVAKRVRQCFRLANFRARSAKSRRRAAAKFMGIFFADQRHFHNCFHACTNVCIFRGLGSRL
jgi:predicted oxidoreductase (fatty acid repression mutant protein)